MLENGSAGLEDLLTYKGVHALCTLNQKTRELKASHYAILLVAGSQPVWGVWSVYGKLKAFYGSKAQIAEAYPKLVWRRRMATWQVKDIVSKTVAARKQELRDRYGALPGDAP